MSAQPSHQIDLTMTDGVRVPAYLVKPPQGLGPALLMLHGAAGLDAAFCVWCDRFAEEGYAVLAPDLGRHRWEEHRDPATLRNVLSDILTARTALAPYLEAAAKTGVVGFGIGATIAAQLATLGMVDALGLHISPALASEATAWHNVLCPAVVHVAGPEKEAANAATLLRTTIVNNPRLRIYDYADQRENFAFSRDHDDATHAATLAHSRTLETLRPVIGPHHDFARLFAEHVRHEFVTHDADATMATMVKQPYVNHVPTLTGGYGHDMLKRFYKYHFIPHLPEDRHSVQISETVGPDGIVIELVNTFTHNEEIEYLLPGIPASGKQLQVPVCIVAKFHGDKLYHEHIYWDQATLLVQLGLLDPKGLPVAGQEQARKMLDQSQPANRLMPGWDKSAGKPLKAAEDSDTTRKR